MSRDNLDLYRPLGRSVHLLWPRTLAVLLPLLIVLVPLAVLNSIAAGIVYALAVITLSFWRPPIALMLAFSLAPFVQELPIPGPVHISIGEFTLALCLPAFMLVGLKNFRFPFFLFFSILYLLVCCLSCLLANYESVPNGPKDALAAMVQMVLYLIVTVLVFSSFLDRPRLFVFVLEGALGVGVFLALLTYTPFSEHLSLHKNSLGASMSVSTVIAIESWFAAAHSSGRRRILMGVVIFLSITLLYTLSRGAWIGALAGVFVIICLRRQFKLFGILLAVLAPLLAVLFLLLPPESQEYALGVSSDRMNIAARYATIDYTLGQFASSPIFGVGIHLRKDIDATNLVCVSLAESGILGFMAFMLMHAAVLRSVWKTQKLIPRSDLLYSPVALGGALVITQFTHGLVDHYWSRGSILQAWAATGMSAAIYFSIRARRKRRQRRTDDFPQFASNSSLSHGR